MSATAVPHFRCPQTKSDARERAEEWACAWNAEDLEAALSHFKDEATFSSPVALDVVGCGTLAGKNTLRRYWTRALRRVGTPRFVVDHVLWDEEDRELVIFYWATFGEVTKRACERMRLDEAGFVIEADALYGAMAEL